MKTITINCANCASPVEKPLKEYRRRMKRGAKMFCNLSCSCSFGNKANPRAGNIELLDSGNRQDEFSSFRYYLNKARSAERVARYGNPDLTLEFLKQLWENQRGICPYTGKQMTLPKNTQDHHIKGTPLKASLDRIDSTKGYLQGNVEFICLAVNLAKNSFSRDQMLAFFK